MAKESREYEEKVVMYNDRTLQIAKDRVPRMREIVLRRLGFNLGEPDFCPGGDRSVDVHWETEEYEVLLNVRPDGSARYYGDNHANKKIEGGLR